MTTPSHEPASYKAIDRFVQRISANIEDELSEYANTKDHINSACAEHVAALEKEKRALQDEIHNANYRMRQLEETRAQTLAKQRDTHKASFHDVLRSASDYLVSRSSVCNPEAFTALTRYCTGVLSGIVGQIFVVCSHGVGITDSLEFPSYRVGFGSECVALIWRRTFQTIHHGQRSLYAVWTAPAGESTIWSGEGGRSNDFFHSRTQKCCHAT